MVTLYKSDKSLSIAKSGTDWRLKRMKGRDFIKSGNITESKIKIFWNKIHLDSVRNKKANCKKKQHDFYVGMLVRISPSLRLH